MSSKKRKQFILKHNTKILNKLNKFDYPKSPSFKDLSGLDFGYLHVNRYIGQYVNKSNHTNYFECQCKCGNITYVSGNHLTRGAIRSCGCLADEELAKRDKIIHTIHGGYGTPLYEIYGGIKARCYNPNFHAYQLYGGRGIKMCDEWKDPENGFKKFRDWSYQNGYSDGCKLSIDRIDNDGNYCPENCRWVTRKVQMNNRSANRYIHFDKYVFSIKIWSEILNIPGYTITSRLDKGWSVADALLTEKGKTQKDGYCPGLFVPKEYEIYNKYDEWVNKGIITNI